MMKHDRSTGGRKYGGQHVGATKGESEGEPRPPPTNRSLSTPTLVP